MALKRIDREVILVKICNDLLPTATTLLKWNWQNHDNCCLCGKSETRDHMIRCSGKTREHWRIKTISKLRKKMQYMDTEFELEHTLASAISECFETGHVSVNKYPEKLHDAIWSQGAIGWR